MNILIQPGRFYFSILAILFFSSCHFTNSENSAIELFPLDSVAAYTKTVNIPESLDSMHFYYNDMLRDVRYVKLESNNECLIGTISKVIVTPDFIVIGDFYISNSVFFFTKQGQFAGKISVNKPSDSIRLENIKDMTYDYDNNRIIVYDYKANYIYQFTESGKYLNRYRSSDLSFMRFNYIGKNKFAFYEPSVNRGVGGGYNDFLLAIGDEKCNISYTAYRNDSTISSYDYNLNLPNSGETVYFCPKFSHTIYEIKNDKTTEITGKIKFNFSAKNSIIDNKSQVTTVKDLEMLTQAGHYNFDGKCFVANDVLFIELTRKTFNTGIFYSQKTGKIIGWNPILNVQVKDTVHVSYYSYPIASTGDEFISVMDPDIIARQERTFARIARENQLPQSPREHHLQEILSTMNENDNPVLLFYKLKQF
ncbi:6-bladed beta-propeller [Niastella caeni]|uniref:6-bladed beta-propeller n=1 Tax=Niastella caeni TaxID=2569763 RepID=A0A4S8HZN7_9BACT|nr:6-bladed beta-propeller [Niastella caeni]THU41217.1 6-bladed beta-propeller [Niastella caeni]